jgi:hypothetical protein
MFLVVAPLFLAGLFFIPYFLNVLVASNSSFWNIACDAPFNCIALCNKPHFNSICLAAAFLAGSQLAIKAITSTVMLTSKKSNHCISTG